MSRRNFISKKAAQFSESVIREMTRLAQKHQAVNLAQGFPDFPAPSALKEAAKRAIDNDKNQYAITWGAKAFRDALAKKHERTTGIAIDPERELTVCCGSTEAMISALLATVDPGEEVIVFEPWYENYGPDAILSGATPVYVKLRAPDWSYDPAELRAAFSPRTKGIIVNTPHNPTGAVLSAGDWERIAELIEPTGAMLLSDEVYECLVFDGGRHSSVLSNERLRGRCFAVFSFGKTYNATGWKIGYCVAAPALTAEFRKVHQFLTFSVSTPVQYAIADFMREEPAFHDGQSAFYQVRRDRFAALLAGSRFRLKSTAGTYFQLADYGDISQLPDAEFCRELTLKHGVAAIPLSPFCAEPMPSRLVRFCFAKDDATLLQAAERLSRI